MRFFFEGCGGGDGVEIGMTTTMLITAHDCISLKLNFLSTRSVGQSVAHTAITNTLEFISGKEEAKKTNILTLSLLYADIAAFIKCEQDFLINSDNSLYHDLNPIIFYAYFLNPIPRGVNRPLGTVKTKTKELVKNL
jgi:hypothetical protein